MLSIVFNKKKNSIYNILLLGAHSDDIEIGCCGTVLRLLEKYPHLSIYWVVFGSSGIRTEEAFESGFSLLNCVNEKKVIVKGFRDGFFPYDGGEIKEYFEEIKNLFHPDIIFTHYRQDLHQDHRVISDLTWNTFRNHFILEYEIPKYDGDLGTPNFYVHLNESICQNKIQHILFHFKSQNDRKWFTEDTFRSMLRLRGMESNSPTYYSEAFYCRKIIFESKGD